MRKQMNSWCVIFMVTWSFISVSGKPQGSDNRVGLERPSTSPVPEISDCNIDALIGDVFGGGGGNCNNNNPSPPPETPPRGGGGGGGYQPLPTSPPINNGDGYQPNPPDGTHYQECEGGECVPFYLCSDNNTIIEDGAGVIDIRLKDDCGSYDVKCCGGTNIKDKPIFETPQSTNNRCGFRNVDGVGVRITGAQDNEAQYGEFPWMVAVVQPHPTRLQDGKPVNIYQCGGSLIHPQVVLTGAHCVRGKNNLVIRAGEWDTQTKNELYPTQDRLVQEVIIHENFNNNTLANDPALLILGSPVDTSVENVGLICLPEENENMDGRDCVASGWGKDQFGKEGKYQVILKRVDVPIVPRNPCLQALRNTRLGSRFKLHESFICAGGIAGRDTCKGDGGSPLVCPSRGDPNVYVQAGIVAWGINCGTETPGVYASVPHFVSWINNKLQQRSITLESCGNTNCEKPNYKPQNNPFPDNNNEGSYNPPPSNNDGNYNPPHGNGNNGGESSAQQNNNGYSGPSLENDNISEGYNPSRKNHSDHPPNTSNNDAGYNPPPQNTGSDHNTPPHNGNNGNDKNHQNNNNGNQSQNHNAGNYHQTNNDGNHNQNSNDDKHHQNNSDDKHNQNNNGGNHNQTNNEGNHHQNNNAGNHYQNNNDDKHTQNNNDDKHHQNNNDGNHNQKNNDAKHTQNNNDDKHNQNNNGGNHNQTNNEGNHHQNNNEGNHYQTNNEGNHHQKNNEGNHYQNNNDDKHHQNNNGGNHNQTNNEGNHHQNNNDGNNYQNHNDKPKLPVENNVGGQNTSFKDNSTNPKDCECVPFHLCEDNNTNAEDGVGLLDLRTMNECGTYDQKCCEKSYIRQPSKPDLPPIPKRCGIRNVDGVGVRITGAQDNEAQYAEFPWMVAVVQPHPTRLQDGKPVNVYQCGGSLIHPQVVLTGAHCVGGKDNLVVRAGEWDTQTDREIHPTQDRLVQEVVVHEEFNNKSLFNDAALLILDSPVDTSAENVGFICLPEENENMEGRDCVASGWGKDQFGQKGKYQVILKRVDVPIVPREPCLEALRKTKLGIHFKLHQSFICAGGKIGKDTCKGDGGSPLACPSRGDSNVYVQAGIVAWGINCGTETPGVYVNVPHFISWINNKLQKRGISL